MVLICGDRNWTDRESIGWFIEHILPKHTVILQGGCRGADTIAKEEGEKQGHKVITIDADWKKYGLAAGPIRNEKMLAMKPNWVVAFHENIEKSRGTKNMIGLAKKAKISWIVCDKNGVTDQGYYGD